MLFIAELSYIFRKLSKTRFHNMMAERTYPWGAPFPGLIDASVPPRVDLTVLDFRKWSYQLIIILSIPLQLIAEVIEL
jgi:hypothetical protein